MPGSICGIAACLKIYSEVYKGISSNHQYKCHTQVKMSAKQINVTADVYNAGVFLM